MLCCQRSCHSFRTLPLLKNVNGLNAMDYMCAVELLYLDYLRKYYREPTEKLWKEYEVLEEEIRDVTSQLKNLWNDNHGCENEAVNEEAVPQFTRATPYCKAASFG